MSSTASTAQTFRALTGFPNEITETIYQYLGVGERRHLVKGNNESDRHRPDFNGFYETELRSESQKAFAETEKALSAIARDAPRDSFVLTNETMRTHLGLAPTADLIEFLTGHFEEAVRRWTASKHRTSTACLIPRIGVKTGQAVERRLNDIQEEMRAVFHFFAKSVTGVIDSGAVDETMKSVTATEGVPLIFTDIVFQHRHDVDVTETYKPFRDSELRHHLAAITDAIPDLEVHLVDSGIKGFVRLWGRLPRHVSIYSSINVSPSLSYLHKSDYAMSLRWFCGAPSGRGTVHVHVPDSFGHHLDADDNLHSGSHICIQVPMMRHGPAMLAALRAQEDSWSESLAGKGVTFNIVPSGDIARRVDSE